jgi:ribosome-binding factor A
MSTIKQQRMAERIRELLTDILYREAHDPHLENITVTEVRIDREMQHARIWVNALDGEEEKETQAAVMAALERASGFLRREMAQSLQLRIMPQLSFRWDSLAAQAERINQILDSLEISEPEPEPEAEPPAADSDAA